MKDTARRQTISRRTLLFAALLGATVASGCSEPKETEYAQARADLTMSLTGIEFGCSTDPSGAMAGDSFHPDVAERYRVASCNVTAETIDAFGDAHRSTVKPLAGTTFASKASALGIDPKGCLLFSSGDARIATCNGGAGIQIVHLERPGKVN